MTVDRYTGPGDTADPPLTPLEQQACMVASMYRYLAKGDYVQYQPAPDPEL